MDTNIYCDFAEGVPIVVGAIAEHGEHTFIPAMLIGELSYGFMKGKRQEHNERMLRRVISRLKIDIINIDEDVARIRAKHTVQGWRENQCLAGPWHEDGVRFTTIGDPMGRAFRE